MKLYVINEVLYDYTPGMCVIAAESQEQCRQMFIDEFGDQHADEFDAARITVIDSVGLPSPCIVSYVYGGG